MQLFAPRIAFVDLETTGMRAAQDRITEVAIVTVDGGDPAEGLRVDAWSTLVDPEVPIPAEIQALTGITEAMVRGAPTFSSVAAEVAARLEARVFVAHNARFDHGFLKHAFERCKLPFRTRPLCTVRLSRRLAPEAEGHGLDALIARYALAVEQRHRALGDAQALWLLLQALYARFDAARIEAEVKRILRIPSLPPQLAANAIESLPEAPGVYRFYGDNALPLYIGKARDLRERVGAHFSSDWRSETDLRLSAEIRRIEVEETAGELGALIREATLVKTMMPAHNRALRRKREAGVLKLDEGPTPRYVAADEVEALAGSFGPFSSKRAARAALRELADEHRLCLTRLKLERREGPCFARQLGRCDGACVGAEPATLHDLRLAAALARFAIPRWPFAYDPEDPSAGLALIRESRSAGDGERCDVHVVRDWRWIGTASDDAALAELLAAPPRAVEFDIDVTRLLLRLYARSPQRFIASRLPSACRCDP